MAIISVREVTFIAREKKHLSNFLLDLEGGGRTRNIMNTDNLFIPDGTNGTKWRLIWTLLQDLNHTIQKRIILIKMYVPRNTGLQGMKQVK